LNNEAATSALSWQHSLAQVKCPVARHTLAKSYLRIAFLRGQHLVRQKGGVVWEGFHMSLAKSRSLSSPLGPRYASISTSGLVLPS